MRLLLAVLVVAAAIVLALNLGGGDSDSPGSLETALRFVSEPVGVGCEPVCAPTQQPRPTPCGFCDQDEEHWRSLTTTAPPSLLGTSAALLEGSCRELIYGLHAHSARQPASLAKIVTGLVVRAEADLSEVVDITIDGWQLSVESESSIMGLKPGMRLTVEELLYGLLLPSGNDAALQLAEHLGGEGRVVELMNQHVRDLGLEDTHLRNTHGLDEPGSRTTPFDMTVLGSELLRDPVLSEIVTTEFRPAAWHEQGGMWNGNYLLHVYEDSIGIKTGFTEAAGWSIVSAAERDGRLLVASVFNSGDPYWDSMQLFDWAFDNVPSAC